MVVMDIVYEYKLTTSHYVPVSCNRSLFVDIFADTHLHLHDGLMGSHGYAMPTDTIGDLCGCDQYSIESVASDCTDLQEWHL